MVETYCESSNTALGPDQPSESWDGPWVQSDRHPQRRSIHRVDRPLKQCNCVCIFLQFMNHWQLHTPTPHIHTHTQCKREVRNRQCTICDHCLRCQIALLLANYYLCNRTQWWVSSLENIGEEEKGEQIKAFPVSHVWWLSQARPLTAHSDKASLGGLYRSETRNGEVELNQSLLKSSLCTVEPNSTLKWPP